MERITSLNLCISIVQSSTIGFGAHRGCAGILHTIGAIGLVGGILTTALLIISIGTIAIGIITTIHTAPIVPYIIIVHITNLCVRM